MNLSKPSVESLKMGAVRYLSKLRRYSVVLFILVVAVIYGFVYMRFNTLKDIEPTEDAVSSQVKASKVPRIDPAVVRQLKTLQDNSVSVQTLFDEARDNPFQ